MAEQEDMLHVSLHVLYAHIYQQHFVEPMDGICTFYAHLVHSDWSKCLWELQKDA